VSDAVRVLADVGPEGVEALAARDGVGLAVVGAAAEIPGAYWGAPEAGLIGARLFARDDTPLHSIVHELGHYVCMSEARRRGLDTDAGGSDEEECAVCYLQVVLADAVPGFGRARCFADMRAWGYSFREGSPRAWFAGDGCDARAWLLRRGLLDARERSTWRLRGAARRAQSFVGLGASP
jgi:hypothetical protein